MTARTTSADGLALIQDYEGFHAAPAPLPDGRWLVGYGHVRAEQGEAVSAADAVNLLKADLLPIEGVVNALVTQPLTQSQFDALASFAFSVGAEALVQSQVLRRVNTGEYAAAACAMDAWRKSDVSGESEVLEALVRRRTAEKAMFLQDLPRKAAPSVLVRAQLDHAAAILGAPMKFAAAPEIASAPLVVATVEAPAQPVETPANDVSEPLLLTQVVANDVEFEAANADAAVANIPFVALPVDRRIRDGEKRVFSAALKSMWKTLRAPRSQEA